MQHSATAVFQERPDAAALRLPAEGVQPQRPEPLRQQYGLIHLQLSVTRLEVEFPHRVRLGREVIGMQILEVHA